MRLARLAAVPHLPWCHIVVVLLVVLCLCLFQRRRLQGHALLDGCGDALGKRGGPANIKIRAWLHVPALAAAQRSA
jgi:hypothetical protein